MPFGMGARIARTFGTSWASKSIGEGEAVGGETGGGGAAMGGCTGSWSSPSGGSSSSSHSPSSRACSDNPIACAACSLSAIMMMAISAATKIPM